MFRNQEIHKLISKENRFNRQFVFAAILVLVVNANVLLFIMQKIDRLPTAYWIQLGFIPLLIIFMLIYYFRLSRKEIKRIQDDYNSKIFEKDQEVKK